MTRSAASHFGMLIVAALTINLSACSEDSSLAPQSSVDAPIAATGFLTFPDDPSIADILVSGCFESELPFNLHVTPWQHTDERNAIELAVGCYDVRIIRITAAGHVYMTQRVVINGGDVHLLA